MRRLVVAIVVGIVGSLALAGCGSSSLSYNDGYAVGQTLAANYSGETSPHAFVVSICARQFKLSASAADQKPAWVNGCVHGFAQVQAEVTSFHT